MRVLIVEYLHAQSEAYKLASDSMLAEGRMMLTAIVEDLGRIDGVTGAVALCQAAANDFSFDQLDVLMISTGPEPDFDEQLLAACRDLTFDKVFVVAPECGGILARITRRLRSANFNVVGASLHTISVCTDKLATAQFLERQRISGVPTRPLTQFARLETTDSQEVVVKPRDGAGCDNIVKLTTSQLKEQILSLGLGSSRTLTELFDSPNHATTDTLPYLNSPDDFIVQPFIQGTSYSIGIIGRGENAAALILPVAVQKIEWSKGRPGYCGGIIPATVTDAILRRMIEMAESIAAVLKIQSGYIGIDFLVDAASQEVYVTEINPRLCTSYVGYRQATMLNLVAVMLQLYDVGSVEWTTSAIEFGVG